MELHEWKNNVTIHEHFFPLTSLSKSENALVDDMQLTCLMKIPRKLFHQCTERRLLK